MKQFLRSVFAGLGALLLFAALPAPAEALWRAPDQMEPLPEAAVSAVHYELQTLRIADLPEEVCFACPALAPGQARILSPGRAGTTELTVQVCWKDGRICSRQICGRKVLQPGEPRVVLTGIDRSLPARLAKQVELPDEPFVYSAGGVSFSYTRVLHCEATAYSCEGYAGTTAIGTAARVGAIAVDPAVIPYGTRLYIVSDDGAYVYGFAVAEDCGSFSGNRIDLYFDTTEECIQFGRRACTVYVLS